MTDKQRETAAQKRMRLFREAQALTAAARQRAKQKSLPDDDDQ